MFDTTIIQASSANIIKRYDDYELVAVLHDNGFVAIYSDDGDVLHQISNFQKSETISPVDLADKLVQA